jgi:lactoylglutathione lyase
VLTPRLNLVVIRSVDLDRAASFYGVIGLTFSRHAHGKGPVHFACETKAVVFEIYPHDDDSPIPLVRIGFAVTNVDATVSKLSELGAVVRQQPKDSAWGRRAVVEDFDGNIVELNCE